MKNLLLTLLILGTLNAFATEQVMDKLEYDGQQYLIGVELKGLSRPLWHFPLETYLKQEKVPMWERLQPYRTGMTTACHRGYVADFLLKDSKLFLLRLNSDPYIKQKAKEYPLNIVDLDWKSPVFANWYTGDFLLCKRIAYEFYNLVPVYNVQIKQGKVIKVTNFAHWLRSVAVTSEKMKKQLAAYRKQNLNPYQAWDEDLCQNFFRCFHRYRIKPGMTLSEIEDRLRMFDPDGEHIKVAKKVKIADSGADGVLRFYVFKLKKNTQSKEDVYIDILFKADKFKEVRIGIND